MMVGGAMLALGGSAVQGMWLALLGWFLYRAASNSIGGAAESPRPPDAPRSPHTPRYELPDERRSNA
jgi:hypothetical protein